MSKRTGNLFLIMCLAAAPALGQTTEERRAREAEQRAREMQQRAIEDSRHGLEAQQRAKEADERAREAEQRAREESQRDRESQQRVKEAEQRVLEVKQRAWELESRGMELENFDLDDLQFQLRDLERVRVDLDPNMHLSFLMAQAAPAPAAVPSPQAPPTPPSPPEGIRFKYGRNTDPDRAYSRGTSYLDRREWENATEMFQVAIDNKGTKADGAMYWKAYAQNKLGRKSDAQATLAELAKSYPSSRWLNDAKALEVEMRGQSASPENESDEELKLIALQSLIHSDPERAIPIVEKLVLQRSASPKLKERALFVLAQIQSPGAREILVRVAKGGSNPDLQVKAVEYLGVHGGTESRQVLADVYGSTNDMSVKRAVLRAYMSSRDKDRLLAAVKSEQSQELRREAIRGLGGMNATTELWQLFQAESSPEARLEILRVMPGKGNADKLLEIAKTDKDLKIRREAIQRLAHGREWQSGSSADATQALMTIYNGEQEPSIRKEIIAAFRESDNAKAVVEIARKEKDPELKRYAVRSLSEMRSKEATDYLLELLK